MASRRPNIIEAAISHNEGIQTIGGWTLLFQHFSSTSCNLGEQIRHYSTPIILLNAEIAWKLRTSISSLQIWEHIFKLSSITLVGFNQLHYLWVKSPVDPNVKIVLEGAAAGRQRRIFIGTGPSPKRNFPGDFQGPISQQLPR